MSRFILSICCIFSLLMTSCNVAATFNQPQPNNVKSLMAFPERVRGKYVAADQASTMTISQNMMTRHYDFDFKEHRDSLDSSYKIIGDTLFNLTDSTVEKITLKGDSIIRHFNGTDTLFAISDNNILKKFKGYYFLNIRFSDSAWEVKKLSLKKGVLTVADIAAKDDLQKLKEITETTADTTSTNFTLTRRQFKEFIKQDGFSEEEAFTRVTGNGK